MLWAQITLLILLGVALLMMANRHGKTEKKVHSFWTDLVGFVIEFGLILAAGGFSRIF